MPTQKYAYSFLRLLVDHFPKSRRLFLAATKFYKGMPILQYNPCFYLSWPEAVKRGIIRDIDCDELITPAVDSITVVTVCINHVNVSLFCVCVTQGSHQTDFDLYTTLLNKKDTLPECLKHVFYYSAVFYIVIYTTMWLSNVVDWTKNSHFCLYFCWEPFV